MTADFPFLLIFLKINRCDLEILDVLQLKAENHSSGDLVHQKTWMWNSKEKYHIHILLNKTLKLSKILNSKM